MVKGLPGSGKSMLLKHLALTDGKQGGFNNSSARPIPVLVELHELTNPTFRSGKIRATLFIFNNNQRTFKESVVLADWRKD